MRTLLTLLCALGVAVAGDSFEERIGRVIRNTGQLKRIEEAPPDDAVTRWRQSERAEDGSLAYDFETAIEDDDFKRIAWRYQVRVLPSDWKPVAEKEAAWKKREVARDKETDAGIAFTQGTRKDKRYTRVYFRLVRGGLKLIMSVLRPGDEEQAEAIAKARPRWHFFVKEAEHYKLFDRPAIVVVPSTPLGWSPPRWAEDDVRGKGPLADGGVVSFVHHHAEDVVVPLSVRVNAPEIEADKPYQLRVRLRELGAQTVRLMRGRKPVPDSDNDGWLELEAKRGDRPVTLQVAFTEFEPEKHIDQIAQLRFEYRLQGQGAETPPRAQLDVAVQRRDWWPVVTRFELVRVNVLGTDAVPPEAPKAKAKRYAETFNGARARARDRLVAWDKLYPRIMRRRAFRKHEPVPMSWRIDGARSLLCAHRADRLGLPGVPNGQVAVVAADVTIVCAPPLTNGGFDVTGDEPSKIDPAAVEKAMRARVRVVALSLGALFLDSYGFGRPASKGVADFERLVHNKKISLAEALRKQAPKKPKPLIVVSDRAGAEKLDDYFPLGARTQPHRLWRTISTGTPGVREVFFELLLRDKAEDPLDFSRGLSVALRFNVPPSKHACEKLNYSR